MYSLIMGYRAIILGILEVQVLLDVIRFEQEKSETGFICVPTWTFQGSSFLDLICGYGEDTNYRAQKRN